MPITTIVEATTNEANVTFETAGYSSVVIVAAGSDGVLQPGESVYFGIGAGTSGNTSFPEMVSGGNPVVLNPNNSYVTLPPGPRYLLHKSNTSEAIGVYLWY
jgi:hypothetical protein